MSRWSERTGHGYVYLDVTRTGYSQSGNYSTFHFKMWFDADSGYGGGYDNEAYYRLEIDPGNHVSTQSSYDFDISVGGTDTFTEGDVNIDHDANGYLTINAQGTVTVHSGSTINGTYNLGGTAVQPRIPKPAGTPPRPVVRSVTSNSLSFYLDEPSNENGSDVHTYNYQVDNNSDFSSPVANVVDSEINGRDFGSVGGLTPPASTWYVRNRWQNVAGWSPWSPTLTITLGIVAPTAPATPTVVRVSDTTQTVTWTRNASTAAPYSSQQVQRRELSNGVWGAWGAIATVGTAYTNSGSSSISDTSSVPNKQYQYRVKATNSAGEAYSGSSVSVFTTPAAPSTVDAEKQSDGSILVTVTQAVSHTSYKTTLQYSLNGGTSWTALTTLNNGVNTYLWTPPAGSSVVFQASVAVDSAGSVGTGLTSTWARSNTVGLTAPPAAPSNLAPNGPAFDASLEQTFSWKHNTLDSSHQTAYEIHYRIGTGAWVTTGKVTSAISSRVFPAGTFTNGNSYQWEVRTYGAHATASPWSATATFKESAPPSVTISSPGTTLDTSTLLLAWNYFDPEGSAQSLWEAQLLLQDEVIETQSGSGATSSIEFATRLTDATEYQVTVRVRDGDSLWSNWDQVTFTTDFLTPPVPDLNLSWDDTTGTVAAAINNLSGDIDATSNVLVRSLDGGQSWEEVGVAPVNGTGFDPTVPLGLLAVQYKVIAWTDLPSSSESLVQEISTVYEVGYWSVGDMFQTVIQLRINQGGPPKIDLTTGIYQKILHYYAGRTSPVETIGEATAVTGSVEFVVTSVAERNLARLMALMPAPHLFRLPDGTLVFSSVGEVSETRLAEGWYQISFNITEVDR